MKKYLLLLLLLLPIKSFATVVTLSSATTTITYNAQITHDITLASYLINSADYYSSLPIIWGRETSGGNFTVRGCIEFNITNLTNKKIRIVSAILTGYSFNSGNTTIRSTTLQPSTLSASAQNLFDNCITGTTLFIGNTGGSGNFSMTFNAHIFDTVIQNKYLNKISWLGIGFQEGDNDTHGDIDMFNALKLLKLTVIYTIPGNAVRNDE
jgi:hypothetical protein